MGENTTRATFDGKWDRNRGSVTFKIGKKDVAAFLLFDAADLPGLYEMIGNAMRGTDDRAAT
jgi:hypothetical protein